MLTGSLILLKRGNVLQQAERIQQEAQNALTRSSSKAQKQAQRDQKKPQQALPGGYLVRLTSLAASAIAGVIAVAYLSWAKVQSVIHKGNWFQPTGHRRQSFVDIIPGSIGNF